MLPKVICKIESDIEMWEFLHGKSGSIRLKTKDIKKLIDEYKIIEKEYSIRLDKKIEFVEQLEKEIEGLKEIEKDYDATVKNYYEYLANSISKDKIKERIDFFFDNLIYASNVEELKESLKETLLEEE